MPGGAYQAMLAGNALTAHSDFPLVSSEPSMVGGVDSTTGDLLSPCEHDADAPAAVACAKRKASALLASSAQPPTQLLRQKLPRDSGHAAWRPGTMPPSTPPGEAFAAEFLREYVDCGVLLTQQGVTRLVSNAGRKWALASELVEGWYVIDDASGTGQALPQLDISAARQCGWKVTGPQMKVFNASVPVQIRYGNPKSCTPEYAAMRAALYTWCHQEGPSGDVVEASIKLIHVYVGRASRTRKRSGDNRAQAMSAVPEAMVQPHGAIARAIPTRVGVLTESRYTSTSQRTPEPTGADVLRRLQTDLARKIMRQLRAQSMDDAALVVQELVASHFVAVDRLIAMHSTSHETTHVVSGTVSSGASAAVATATDSPAAEEERQEQEEATRIGGFLRSRAEIIAMLHKEYARLYHVDPPRYEEDAIAWLLKKLQAKSYASARRMARVTIAYERKHKEAHDITVKSHNMAAQVLHMLGAGDDLMDLNDQGSSIADSRVQLPTPSAPPVISYEEATVAHNLIPVADEQTMAVTGDEWMANATFTFNPLLDDASIYTEAVGEDSK